MKLSTKTLIGLGIVGVAGAATVAVKAYKSAKTLIENEIDVRNGMFERMTDPTKPNLISIAESYQLVASDGNLDGDSNFYTLVSIDTVEGLRSTLKTLQEDEIFSRVVCAKDCSADVSVEELENSDLVEFKGYSIEAIQCVLMARLEKFIVESPISTDTDTGVDADMSEAFLIVDNDPAALFQALGKLYELGLITNTINLSSTRIKELDEKLATIKDELKDSDHVRLEGSVHDIHEKLVYLMNVYYGMGDLTPEGSIEFDIESSQKMVSDVENFLKDIGVSLNTEVSDEDVDHECVDEFGKPYFEPVGDTETDETNTPSTNAEIKNALDEFSKRFHKGKKGAEKTVDKVLNKSLNELGHDAKHHLKRGVRYIKDEFNEVGRK